MTHCVKAIIMDEIMLKVKALTAYLLLSLALASQASAFETPSLGDAQQAFLNPSQEKLMGKQFMHAVRYHVPVVDDPIVNDYLQQLGAQLGAHTQHQSFHFFAVNEPSINAFAGPGGYIGINAGLVTTTENEAELAAVLAHEMMHVEQRHIARRLDHDQQRHWPSIGGIIAAVIIGAQLDSSVATGAILGATASQMQQGISMTRQFELEADRLGIALLDQSGFDVMAMPKFFERMQQKTLDYGSSRFKILRTHPVTQERIADSMDRAKQYARKARQIHEDYPLIKARLRVLSSSSPEDILSYYEKAMNDQQSLENHYGYALALARMHQPQLAVNRLNILAQNHPKSATIATSIAEITSHYAPEKAKKIYQKIQRQFPKSYAVVMNFAELLLQKKDYQEVINLLALHRQNLQEDPHYHWFISQAHGQSGNLYLAYLHRMELHDLLGQPAMAVKQGHEAIKHAPNYEKKLIIKEKIRKLRYDIELIDE